MKRTILLIMAVALGGSVSFGQISGVKTIPGDYATVAAAISTVNTSGVGTGGVTFNVAAGYTETFSNLSDGLITATGTTSGPIIFQKSGTGANPLITAATPGIGNYDYIFCIGGGDYITFDGINIQDNPANATATTRMEYGFALLKASGTNGAQYNTLKNGAISLSFNTNAYGIFLENWNYSAPGTALTVTAVSGTNSWNKFNSLTFNNCYGGINLKGYADVDPFAFYDQDNEIGTVGGNTFNYSGMTGTTVISYGINAISQNGLVIANNTFTGSMSMTTGRYYAMNLLDSDNADLDVYNNTLSISFTGTGHFYGFYISGMGRNGRTNSVNFYNNQIINNTFPNHTNGNVVYTYAVTGAVNLNCYSNLISNNTIGSTTANSTGLAYYMYFRSDPLVPQTGVINMHSNTISNNSRSSLAATVSALTYLLYNTGSTATLNIYGNVINNITALAGNAYGIFNAHIGQSKNIYNNIITNISGKCGNISGIYNANGIGNTYIHHNRIQNLSNAGYTYNLEGIVGIQQTTGNNQYYYNNYIGQFYTPTGQKTSAVIGFSIGGLNNNYTGFYNNTIYFDGTSANDGFGVRGIYAESNAELDLRNNIVVVNTVPTGEYGSNVAYLRTNDNLDTYQQVSNNNNFFAGTPGPRNLIYMAQNLDSIQTLAEYQAFVSPRDAQSIAELPPFVNVTTSPYDLHLAGDVITKCESGGLIISSPLSIITDYDGHARYPNSGYPNNPLSPAIAPDIGADEFAGIYADLIPPFIDYTPLINTSVPGERTLTAAITDPSGVPASGIGLPVLYWRINNGSWMPATANWTNGNSYSFTFGGGAVLNDIVYYYVAAQDMAPSLNVGCRPIGGAGGFTSNPPACSIPPANPDNYTIVGTLCGLYTVGVGKDYATITTAVADLNTKEVICPVIFELWDETYSTSETFPLIIYPFLGASADHPVTFRPKPSGNSTINGSSDQGILVLKGCQFITIDGSNSGGSDRNLTWENTSTTADSYTIGVLNDYPQGTSNCTIKNNNIKSSQQLTVNTYGIFLDPAWGGFDNITIDNNYICSARNGILFAGKWNNKATNGKIINNTIGSLILAEEIKFQGIIIIDAVNTLIRGNEIIGPVSGNTNTNQVGILLSAGADYSQVDRNEIYGFNSTNANGRVSAINLATQSTETPTTITNNLIFRMKAGRNPTGIYLSNGGNALIAHNTVSLTDTTFTATAAATFYSSCLDIGSSSILDIRNNIFLNKQQCVNAANVNPKTYAVYSNSPATTFTNIDYNNYYVNDAVATSGLSGRTGFLSVARNTISDWRTATGKDIYSTDLNPAFVSIFDLVPTNSVLNNLGNYLQQLPDDFSGNLRTNPPDMGAHNFGNDPQITTANISNLTPSSVTLNGIALANNQVVNIYFDYGFTVAYSEIVAGNPSFVSGSVPAAIYAPVSGLTPNSSYHYRARGVTGGGLIIYGEDLVFSTPCIYPDITITGFSAVCSGSGSTIYSTEPGNLDYNWTISGGGIITSGQGTHEITVSWNGEGPQNITVIYTNIYGCAGLNPEVMNVTVHPNPVPTISGDLTGCDTYTGNSYTTEAGMASYIWTVTPGGTITSGQGTNTINVTWNTPGIQTIGVISTTMNGCSVGQPTLLNVEVYEIPGPSVSGTDISCADSDVYDIYTTEGGMSDYLWTVSNGGSIISGQGTYQIEVYWTTAGQKTITVNYSNAAGCAALIPGNMMVDVYITPAAPGPITGVADVCAGMSGVLYSCAPVGGVTYYEWSLPAGATIVSGAGTNAITVDFTPNASSGNITVFGSNLCGNGPVSPAFSVLVSPVPETPVATSDGALLSSSAPEGNQWYFEGEMIAGAIDQTYEATQTGWYWTEVTLNGCTSDTSNHLYVLITGMMEMPGVSVLVYPQPNSGDFNIMLSNHDQAPLNLIIINSLGETVYKNEGIRVDGELIVPVDINPPTSGIYLLILEKPSARITRKVVVR